MPTYTHNNYYGYINRIQEKAISNPEWFWSESDDALQTREWLRNNGAQAIIDDIYKNTPDEMKRRIPAKMLNKTTRENIVVDRQRERTNAAAKNVAMMGAAIAGVPASVSYAAAAPIATGISMLTGATGGFTGSILGKAIGRHIFTNDVEKGIPTVHSNGDKGEEWGGLIGGFLGGAAGAKYGQPVENFMKSRFGRVLPDEDKLFYDFTDYKRPQSWYRPAETYTNATRAKDAQAYTNALDNIQRYFNVTKPKHTKSYNGYKEIVPEINFSTKEPMVTLFNNDTPLEFSLSESGLSIDNPVYNKDIELPFYIQRRYAAQLNHAVDEAKAASAFYKKFNWKHPIHIDSDDNEVLAALLKYHYKEPTITLDPTKSMWESFNDNGHSVIGIKENVFEPHSFPNDRVYLRSVIAHEGGHNNPLYNTAAVADNLTDNQKAALYKESPLYHWDYSRVPEWTKRLLKPRKNVFNAHDIELAESYSDLIGEKALMEKFNLGRDGKYSYLDLLRYKYGKPQGRKTRFFLQHPGLRQQYKAFNEIE